MNKVFALGTVIKLKASDSVVMIMGYYPINQQEKKIYQYLGVIYPFGIGGEDAVVMLDEASVDRVLWEGYMDETAEHYYTNLHKLMESNETKDIFEKYIF